MAQVSGKEEKAFELTTWGGVSKVFSIGFGTGGAILLRKTSKNF
jgi:hypothetical protein